MTTGRLCSSDMLAEIAELTTTMTWSPMNISSSVLGQRKKGHWVLYLVNSVDAAATLLRLLCQRKYLVKPKRERQNRRIPCVVLAMRDSSLTSYMYRSNQQASAYNATCEASGLYPGLM